MTVHKKAILYPFSKEYSDFIKFHNEIGFDCVIPMVDENEPVIGKKVGFIVKDDGNDEIIRAYDDSSIIADKEVTDVLLTTYSDKIKNNILVAAGAGKNIKIINRIEEDKAREIRDCCQNKNVVFLNNEDQLQEKPNWYMNKLREITTPIMLICGLSAETNKFELQIKIRKELVNRGYLVSQIGSKNGSELFGMHSFPQFMYKAGISEMEKIFMFNGFIWNIEETEKPDVIIVGVPGGIMPYDNEHHNEFGIFNYLVSCAVTPDEVVLSIPYNDYETEFWEYIVEYSKYKYSYNIKGINYSNIYHDIYADERQAKERLVYIRNRQVDEMMSLHCNPLLFNIRNDNSFIRKVDELINYLSE